ncbi:uncharacterized protein LOC128200919, partial [Galleria mellonella]|uniref:Uncharacterized protein LOC128200919 n=1 Tax=Galleria mellonella TaxID=7137 RepID=A0ABM3MKD2_GALME
HDNVSLSSEVSGQLYTDVVDDCFSCENKDFTFDIDTKLKEPVVPKTPDDFLKKLLEVQRLGTSSWSDVRYAETQKLYNHTPGYTDLETNEEVKMYDTSRNLAYADKSYAAITFCILKQRESLQEGFRDLLSWAKNTKELNVENLNLQLEQIFQKGPFHKISSDLLQLVCGHRAESIEMRRESIISQVRDPLIKASLNRIPPSATFIFDAEPFTSTLGKVGGMRKAFWPLKRDKISQYKNQPNLSNRHPSRGQGIKRQAVPSRGNQYYSYEPSLHAHACNNPPSRGGYQCQHTVYPPVRYTSNVQYTNTGKGTFHDRGSQHNRGNNRERTNTSRNSHKGNQKIQKQ